VTWMSLGFANELMRVTGRGSFAGAPCSLTRDAPLALLRQRTSTYETSMALFP
jgi:hypothetical protein